MSQAILDLLELAKREGLTLPYSPETIVALETSGAVVDLHTGASRQNRAGNRYSLTVLGEALAVVLESEARNE